MAWARFDDGFPEHPKVDPLSDGAFRLHVSAICWSARNLTDGFLPEVRVPRLIHRHRKEYVTELVKAGLWETSPDGWVIHDYLRFQSSAADVKKKLEADRIRKMSTKIPTGIRSESRRNPSGETSDVRPESAAPSDRNPRVTSSSHPLEDEEERVRSAVERIVAVRRSKSKPTNPKKWLAAVIPDVHGDVLEAFAKHPEMTANDCVRFVEDGIKPGGTVKALCGDCDGGWLGVEGDGSLERCGCQS